MGADPAGLALAAVAVSSAAVRDGIQIKVKRYGGWMESTRAWVALVGPASAKKTPEIAAAARPLSQIDAEMYRTYARAKAQWDAMSADQRRSTPRPKQTRIRLEDVTIEAAQEVLQDSPSGVLCVHDELSGWFGSMDKYAMKVVKVVKTNSVILAIRSRRGGREGREGRENSFPLNFVDVEPVPKKKRQNLMEIAEHDLHDLHDPAFTDMITFSARATSH